MKGKKGWKAIFSKKVTLAAGGIAVIIGVGTGAFLGLSWVKTAGVQDETVYMMNTIGC